MVATARIVFPRACVRLSAGRTELGKEAQLLCLYAGANSIFYGERLLTTGNPEEDADLELMRTAGLSAQAPASAEERQRARRTRRTANTAPSNASKPKPQARSFATNVTIAQPPSSFG